MGERVKFERQLAYLEEALELIKLTNRDCEHPVFTHTMKELRRRITYTQATLYRILSKGE